MTVGHEVFDADLLAAPGTAISLGDINGATVSGNGLGLSNITLTPNIAALGVSSANIYGRGLGLDPGGSGQMWTVDLGGTFGPFDASIDFGGPSTEFGMAIQDWVAAMIIDFYSGGVLVTSFTTPSFSDLGVEHHQYYQMTGGTFDRVDIRASTTAGNWTFAGFTVESTGPAGPALSLTCGGGSATADMTNCTPGGPVAVVYGPANPYVHGGAQCNGLALDLTPANAPLILSADATGAASVTKAVGGAVCGSGILVQAADVATCVATNSEAL